jgi:hypothetical protein
MLAPLRPSQILFPPRSLSPVSAPLCGRMIFKRLRVPSSETDVPPSFGPTCQGFCDKLVVVPRYRIPTPNLRPLGSTIPTAGSVFTTNSPQQPNRKPAGLTFPSANNAPSNNNTTPTPYQHSLVFELTRCAPRNMKNMPNETRAMPISIQGVSFSRKNERKREGGRTLSVC